MEKKCDYCGRTFETNLKRQRFCCKSCHIKWHNDHDESHSWAEYNKRKAKARQRHLTEEQKLKKAEKEAKKQARKEEQEACQNIMSCLMDKISFENYRDLAAKEVSLIMLNVLNDPEFAYKYYTKDLAIRIKEKLTAKVIDWVDDHLDILPKNMSNDVNVFIYEEAYSYIQAISDTLHLGLPKADVDHPDNDYLVVTIGTNVGTGHYWWLGYIHPVWQGGTIQVRYPIWHQFDEWEG